MWVVVLPTLDFLTDQPSKMTIIFDIPFSSKDINKIPCDLSMNVGGATILPSNCAII